MTEDDTTRDAASVGRTPAHAEDDEARRVEALLEGGVPMTLLVDLFGDDVPPSAEILETEGLPAEPWWEDPERSHGTRP